jgi:hypothetical protein
VRNAIWLFVALMLTMPAVALADDPTCNADETWLAQTQAVATETTPAMDETEDVVVDDAPPAKGPPLPLHTTSGYGGGAVTPMAMFCNPGSPGVTPGPSAAYTFISFEGKKFHAVTISQVFFERIEFSYAYNHLNVGSFYNQAKKISGGALNMGHDNVQLHHFNLRVMLAKDGDFGCELMPAVAAGIHFKYNSRISEINDNLGGALEGLGYDDDFGIDFTLVATKLFIEPVFNRPLIFTAGLRLTRAAQLGLFGFGGDYNVNFEGSVVYWPIDQLAIGYEFRQKQDPYHGIPGLLYQEDSMHTILVALILSDRLTVAGVIAWAGDVGNTEDCLALGVQAKYEF